jgi:beta-galactosidase
MAGRLAVLRAFLLFGLLVVSVVDAQAQRIITSFDADWRFHRGDIEGSEQAEFNDADWQAVDVPHDWAIAGPFAEDAPARGEGGFLPTGVGWYRKSFTLPADHKGKRVLIEFDGVMANSDVWINGQHLGHRPNGYVSFHYDITDHMKFGEVNVLAVKTDTSEQAASRWYTGSGIYRHVRLVETGPVYIVPWGVSIAMPRAIEGSAQVVATVTVENGDNKDLTIVRARILNADGREVASKDSNPNSWNDGELPFELTLGFGQPELWDIENPYLYTLETSVLINDEVVDQVSTPFGIRSSEFKSDSGYWLNGRNVKIKGVCLHHDGGVVGAAVPMGVWEYRLEKLKELGVNAIRTAHNPPDPAFLDLCDRMGFLVMDEFFDCWTVAKRRHDYHKHFEEWSHRDMRDTILRDRNHPSVILYSVGNEIHDTPREELAKRILKGLVAVCHDTDPTRPVTQALFRPNVSHDYDNGLADMLDVIGTNYRDPELLDAWRDNPKRKIIGTEQGHERRIWLAARDNPQHSGQFLWVGVDYLGEAKKWPVTTFDSGLLDRTGEPHPRGLERQSWWSDEAMVAMFRREAQTKETPPDPGYEVVEWDRRQVLFPDWTPKNLEPHKENVELYTNCDEVELLQDGKSLGSKKRRDDGGSLNWDVEFRPGKLEAIARNDGVEVVRQELRTAEEAKRVELSLSRKRLGMGWDEVAIIQARVVDENGTILPRAENKITFSANEAGTIIGVDNGSIISHEPFQALERNAFQGKCVAIVRRVEEVGEIVIAAKCDGLESATVTIQAEENQP